jgi:hypothetical protein
VRVCVLLPARAAAASKALALLFVRFFFSYISAIHIHVVSKMAIV